MICCCCCCCRSFFFFSFYFFLFTGVSNELCLIAKHQNWLIRISTFQAYHCSRMWFLMLFTWVLNKSHNEYTDWNGSWCETGKLKWSYYNENIGNVQVHTLPCILMKKLNVYFHSCVSSHVCERKTKTNLLTWKSR